MGTRSLTIVEKNGKPIVCLFGMFDGYPSGHGDKLAGWLAPFTIGNGLCGDESAPFANGIECLAAQLVTRFKTEPGEFYLYPLEVDARLADYTYIISADDDNLVLAVWTDGQRIWSGHPSEWDSSLL